MVLLSVEKPLAMDRPPHRRGRPYPIGSNNRRVGPGVAPWASPRSVLAQLRHTARQVTASPSRCAIRSRSVDKVLRLGVLALFPDRGPVTRPPFPPPGPRGTRSPTSSVLRRAPTPAAPSHRTLGLARQYPRCVAGRGRTTGLSGSWGTLVDVRRVLGPRQDPCAWLLRHTGAAPPLVQTVGSLREA